MIAAALSSIAFSLIVRQAAGEPSTPPRPEATPVPAYPRSPVIEEVRWAPAGSIVRQARDSDNFPVTWGEDDSIYTAWGDGTGFPPKTGRKLGCGFARISGMPPRFSGENIPSLPEELGQGREGLKAWGILDVGGTLHVWFGHADRKGGTARLAWSADRARSWTHAGWRFDEFGLMGFINFGRGYRGARDGFVYS